MSLEVGEVDHHVVVLKVGTHDVVLDVPGVCDGQLHLTFLVHDIYCSDIVETTLGDGPTMGCRCASAATVGRITLHDVAIHLLHQTFDELRAQVVGAARLARGDFHGHAFAFTVHAQCLVDAHQRLRRDVIREIHYGTLSEALYGHHAGQCQ